MWPQETNNFPSPPVLEGGSFEGTSISGRVGGDEMIRGMCPPKEQNSHTSMHSSTAIQVKVGKDPEEGKLPEDLSSCLHGKL